MGNSVKFTDKGFIKLTIFKCTTNSERLVFLIEDSGIGINEKDLKFILGQKDNLDCFVSKKPKKLAGLGLSISNVIASYLGEDEGIQA